MKLTFLGAAGTVTGSKFLLEAGGLRVLVDCGMFQGLKALRQRNWQAPPVDPASIDVGVLTHAHIDHTGYLPRFVRLGYSARTYATPATVSLSELLLPDAARLQEEEAQYRNTHKLTRHNPALPLYTAADAQAALTLLEPLPYRRRARLSAGLSLEFLPAGHILGSAFAVFRAGRIGEEKTILFTGDIGRPDQPILLDPSPAPSADFLVLESTYGNRLHENGAGQSGKARLAEVINNTVGRQGSVLIPSFAVGRAQEILYVLRELEEEGAIPEVPVFVDSPMAIDAFAVFRKHWEEHDAETHSIRALGGRPFRTRDTRFTRTSEESKKINEHPGSCIIISASGMATGGRILHHLTRRLGDARNSVVFVGFQAAGTRGRTLVDGSKTVRIFGIDWGVRAEVHRIDEFSAHGDYQEILDWLEGFERPPSTTFLVHGEPAALDGMRDHIRARFPDWPVVIPQHLDSVDLGQDVGAPFSEPTA